MMYFSCDGKLNLRTSTYDKFLLWTRYDYFHPWLTLDTMLKLQQKSTMSPLVVWYNYNVVRVAHLTDWELLLYHQSFLQNDAQYWPAEPPIESDVSRLRLKIAFTQHGTMDREGGSRLKMFDAEAKTAWNKLLATRCGMFWKWTPDVWWVFLFGQNIWCQFFVQLSSSSLCQTDCWNKYNCVCICQDLEHKWKDHANTDTSGGLVRFTKHLTNV